MSSALEYRTVDKSGWPRGPWDDEPDKAQWRDQATGLPCLIHRGPSGALCGYVGVAADHPWHGHDYRDDRLFAVEVHGGLTFSDGCQHGDDPSTGICHVPEPGEPDDVWWFGFDCAHFGDMSGMAWRTSDPESSFLHSIALSDGYRYRDVAYVRSECARLAAQIAAAAEVGQ